MLQLCGDACLQREDADAVPWSAFYLRRTAHHTPDLSPLDLIQERYCSDAYQLLVACVLCSRTSGGATVHAVVKAFFAAYPTATHVINGDVAALRALLLPLGLNR
jgi:endonuclease III